MPKDIVLENKRTFRVFESTTFNYFNVISGMIKHITMEIGTMTSKTFKI
jgi:hypothetical protein